MFTNSKIAAVILTVGLISSASTQAAEESLESYVTTLVNQAMKVAQQELHNNVQESVINVAQKVSFNGESHVKTKVTITDIKESKNKVVNVAEK